jgi:hypothetical protein
MISPSSSPSVHGIDLDTAPPRRLLVSLACHASNGLLLLPERSGLRSRLDAMPDVGLLSCCRCGLMRRSDLGKAFGAIRLSVENITFSKLPFVIIIIVTLSFA